MSEIIDDHIPFQNKREEIKKSNVYSVSPPRCLTCGELIVNLNPFQVVKYCNKYCRMARTKKGKKRLQKLMSKNKLQK